MSLLYNIHLCVEGCGCSRWFAAGVLFLFALPVVAESLSVTCRIVREDGASETRACPLVASAFFVKHPTRRSARHLVKGLSMADM